MELALYSEDEDYEDDFEEVAWEDGIWYADEDEDDEDESEDDDSDDGDDDEEVAKEMKAMHGKGASKLKY